MFSCLETVITASFSWKIPCWYKRRMISLFLFEEEMVGSWNTASFVLTSEESIRSSILSENVSEEAWDAEEKSCDGSSSCRNSESGISIWKFTQSKPMIRPCSPVIGMVQEQSKEWELFLLKYGETVREGSCSSCPKLSWQDPWWESHRFDRYNVRWWSLWRSDLGFPDCAVLIHIRFQGMQPSPSSMSEKELRIFRSVSVSFKKELSISLLPLFFYDADWFRWYQGV